jgi:hypothetical protein
MGSIVRSTGYMVLHRPVEPAVIVGNWLQHSENPTSHELRIEMELASLASSILL